MGQLLAPGPSPRALYMPVLSSTGKQPRSRSAEELDRMADPKGLIMHAEIRIGDSRIMLSDAAQNPPTSSSHMLYVTDCDAAFKRAVDAGMTVKMPLADQFWGDRCGLVEDKYGNRWAFATHKEDVPREEMGKRAQAAMAAMAKK
jgi:PhnB protein